MERLMQDHGRVSWSDHPAVARATQGHRASEGSGVLIGFAHDEHGQLCGIVETEDGRFRTVRLSELRREEARSNA